MSELPSQSESFLPNGVENSQNNEQSVEIRGRKFSIVESAQDRELAKKLQLLEGLQKFKNRIELIRVTERYPERGFFFVQPPRERKKVFLHRTSIKVSHSQTSSNDGRFLHSPHPIIENNIELRGDTLKIGGDLGDDIYADPESIEKGENGKKYTLAYTLEAKKQLEEHIGVVKADVESLQASLTQQAAKTQQFLERFQNTLIPEDILDAIKHGKPLPIGKDNVFEIPVPSGERLQVKMFEGAPLLVYKDQELTVIRSFDVYSIEENVQSQTSVRMEIETVGWAGLTLPTTFVGNNTHIEKDEIVFQVNTWKHTARLRMPYSANPPKISGKRIVQELYVDTPIGQVTKQVEVNTDRTNQPLIPHSPADRKRPLTGDFELSELESELKVDGLKEYLNRIGLERLKVPETPPEVKSVKIKRKVIMLHIPGSPDFGRYEGADAEIKRVNTWTLELEIPELPTQQGKIDFFTQYEFDVASFNTTSLRSIEHLVKERTGRIEDNLRYYLKELTTTQKSRLEQDYKEEMNLIDKYLAYVDNLRLSILSAIQKKMNTESGVVLLPYDYEIEDELVLGYTIEQPTTKSGYFEYSISSSQDRYYPLNFTRTDVERLDQNPVLNRPVSGRQLWKVVKRSDLDHVLEGVKEFDNIEMISRDEVDAVEDFPEEVSLPAETKQRSYDELLDNISKVIDVLKESGKVNDRIISAVETFRRTLLINEPETPFVPDFPPAGLTQERNSYQTFRLDESERNLAGYNLKISLDTIYGKNLSIDEENALKEVPLQISRLQTITRFINHAIQDAVGYQITLEQVSILREFLSFSEVLFDKGLPEYFRSQKEAQIKEQTELRKIATDHLSRNQKYHHIPEINKLSRSLNSILFHGYVMDALLLQEYLETVKKYKEKESQGYRIVFEATDKYKNSKTYSATVVITDSGEEPLPDNSDEVQRYGGERRYNEVLPSTVILDMGVRLTTHNYIELTCATGIISELQRQSIFNKIRDFFKENLNPELIEDLIKTVEEGFESFSPSHNMIRASISTVGETNLQVAPNSIQVLKSSNTHRLSEQRMDISTEDLQDLIDYLLASISAQGLGQLALLQLRGLADQLNAEDTPSVRSQIYASVQEIAQQQDISLIKYAKQKKDRLVNREEYTNLLSETVDTLKSVVIEEKNKTSLKRRMAIVSLCQSGDGITFLLYSNSVAQEEFLDILRTLNKVRGLDEDKKKKLENRVKIVQKLVKVFRKNSDESVQKMNSLLAQLNGGLSTLVNRFVIEGVENEVDDVFKNMYLDWLLDEAEADEEVRIFLDEMPDKAENIRKATKLFFNQKAMTELPTFKEFFDFYQTQL